MLFLYRFFCGILEVEFFGVYPEKVLNLAAKNGINIWSARYIKQKIRCKITARDFLKLPKILKKSGIRVHILSKKGFPFFIKKYNKRSGIFIGLILFFSIIFALSSFVWIIEVEGNKTVSRDEIIAVCKEIGIREGTLKKRISPKPQAQELLLKMDRLAWASLNLEGCKLTVNVTEITEKTQEEGESNLTALCDGTISHINVTSGNCLVKVGDVVAKGDVLVSGIIETEDGTRFVRSSGEIIAKTETELNMEQKLNFTVAVPTGEPKTKRVLELFTLKIPLFLGGESGEYDTTLKTWQMKAFGASLPVKIYSKKFSFKTLENRKITHAQAVEMLKKRLKNEAEGTVKSLNFKKEKDKVLLTAVTTEEKNIAISQKLIFSIGK